MCVCVCVCQGAGGVQTDRYTAKHPSVYCLAIWFRSVSIVIYTGPAAELLSAPRGTRGKGVAGEQPLSRLGSVLR